MSEQERKTVTYKTISPEKMLEILLSPIKYSYSSSIQYRKQLVTDRHKAVKYVYPFLSEEDKILADKWVIEESHSGLWD